MTYGGELVTGAHNVFGERSLFLSNIELFPDHETTTLVPCLAIEIAGRVGGGGGATERPVTLTSEPNVMSELAVPF